MPDILLVLFMDSIFSLHIGLILCFLVFLIRKLRQRKITELAEVTWLVSHGNGIHVQEADSMSEVHDPAGGGESGYWGCGLGSQT